MGFNNPGAAIVASRLARLPTQPGPICVNVGRNKETPNERAADDYVAAFRTLAPHAQLAAINVSSPNTPGLRELQSELGRLVGEVVKARDALPRRIPILVKLSPDEPDDWNQQSGDGEGPGHPGRLDQAVDECSDADQ